MPWNYGEIEYSEYFTYTFITPIPLPIPTQIQPFQFEPLPDTIRKIGRPRKQDDDVDDSNGGDANDINTDRIGHTNGRFYNNLHLLYLATYTVHGTLC